jgi:hypothetical protein
VTTLLTVYTFLKAHWPQILAILAAIHTLLGAVNALLPADKSPSWLRYIIDRLGAFSQPGMKGTVGKWKLPFKASLKSPKTKVKGKKMKMNILLPFVTIGAMLTASCATSGGQAFTKCELGQLPQNEQAVVACAVGALASPGDWRAEVLACGESLLPAQMSCVIAAIVSAASQGNLKTSLVVQRGQQWLSEHPSASKACR